MIHLNDEDFRAKWVAALRSGDYKQVEGRLLDKGRYCCLGVACRVAGLSDADIKADVLETQIDNFGIDTGLTSEDAHDLAKANDGGATFEEIALCIEGKISLVALGHIAEEREAAALKSDD
jgi:hypothetical protein